jgi:putative ubiquitin-RnfH superfamily antitoxin RatB of RatAB toxin-antitoxin module
MTRGLNIVLLFVSAPADGAKVYSRTVNVAEGTTLGTLMASDEMGDFMRDFMHENNVQEPAAIGAVGVWGRVKSNDYVLRADDRVEIYRPLKADPKDARRAKVEASRTR